MNRINSTKMINRKTINEIECKSNLSKPKLPINVPEFLERKSSKKILCLDENYENN